MMACGRGFDSPRLHHHGSPNCSQLGLFLFGRARGRVFARVHEERCGLRPSPRMCRRGMASLSPGPFSVSGPAFRSEVDSARSANVRRLSLHLTRFHGVQAEPLMVWTVDSPRARWATRPTSGQRRPAARESSLGSAAGKCAVMMPALSCPGQDERDCCSRPHRRHQGRPSRNVRCLRRFQMSPIQVSSEYSDTGSKTVISHGCRCLHGGR